MPSMKTWRLVYVLYVASYGMAPDAMIAACDLAAADSQNGGNMATGTPLPDIRTATLGDLKAKAKSGDTESQYALGRYYETRTDLTYNRLTAVRWYLRAHLSGDVGATSP